MRAPSANESRPLSDRALIGLLGAVQFINILDFMMVMPLGPDFAAGLDIANERLGWIGASYTLSASLSALLGARHLDRFDRRTALVWASLGLALGTLAGALAVDLYSLLAARVVAGAFGGPATAVTVAIVIDRIPEQRRGRAMGALMSAFSVASVVGVPASLELARVGGWQAPFLVVGAAAAAVAGLAWRLLPPMRGHRGEQDGPLLLAPLLSRVETRLGLLLTLVSLIAAFLLIPNLSAYLQFNLDVERDAIGTLYLVGGVVSWFGMRQAGRVSDRLGALPVSLVATALMVAMIWLGYGIHPPVWPVMPVFVLLMLAMTARNVNLHTINARVPRPGERAGYAALNSALQNLGIALGAGLSTGLLDSTPEGELLGMSALVAVMTGFAMLQPWLIWRLEQRLRRRAGTAAGGLP